MRPYLDGSDADARWQALSALKNFKPLPPVEELTRAMQLGNKDSAIAAMVAAEPLGYRAKPIFDTFLENVDKFSDQDRKDVFKNAIRGSWVLADLRDDFLRKAAKNHSGLLVDSLDEIPDEHPVDVASLLDTLATIPDEKQRDATLDKFENFVRLRQTLTSEEKTNLLASIRKAWQEGRGTENLYEIAAPLGEAGANLLKELYDKGTQKDRSEILRTLSFATRDTQSPFWPLVKNIVRSEQTENPNFPRAVQRVAELEPETAFKFMHHSSPQIRKAILQGIHFNEVALARKDLKEFLDKSARDPNTELAREALYQLGKSEDAETWNRTAKTFREIKEGERRRSFIYGTAENPERWKQLFALADKQPTDIGLASDAVIFKTALTSNEEHPARVKMLNSLLRGEGEWREVRPKFFDAFFSSKKSQYEFRRIPGTSTIELIQEWKARGYPRIEPDLHYKWMNSRDAAINELLKDAPPVPSEE